jgi:hypothetical protein
MLGQQCRLAGQLCQCSTKSCLNPLVYLLLMASPPSLGAMGHCQFGFASKPAVHPCLRSVCPQTSEGNFADTLIPNQPQIPPSLARWWNWSNHLCAI